MKINRQGCRSDAISCCAWRGCRREVHLMSVDCHFNFSGKGRKRLIPNLMGLISNTSSLNCDMLSLFSHPWYNFDFNQWQTKACNDIEEPQQRINLRHREAKAQTTYRLFNILINLVETNRNVHWPSEIYQKTISGSPSFISMFRVITKQCTFVSDATPPWLCTVINKAH